MLLGVMLLLAGCTPADRGRCLETGIVTHYHPVEVFVGGSAGYTHDYEPSEDTECTRWEYPDGRPKS
jgi:hypothetical protein